MPPIHENQTTRQMPKYILKVVLGILLVFGANYPIHLFFKQQVDPLQVPFVQMDQIEEIALNGEGISCLFLGDSYFMAGIDPHEIQGSFNFGYYHNSITNIFYLLKDLANEKKLKIGHLIIQMDPQTFNSKRADIFQYNYFHVNYLDFWEIGNRKNKRAMYAGHFIQGKLFKNAGRYSELFNAAFSKKQRIPAPRFRGYAPWLTDFSLAKNPQEISRKRAEIMFKGTQSFDPGLAYYFREVLDFCKENGIKISLVKMPVSKPFFVESGLLMTQWSPYKDFQPVLDQYPEVKVYDYKGLFFDHPEYFSDTEHLNEAGACLFSELLSKSICATK